MKISKKRYLDKKEIQIKKIINTSLIDWEGKIVSTLYVGGCNFRCPFCYNTDLVLDIESLPTISKENILSFLTERKSFLDGICLSGGEPTLYSLTEFLTEIKSHQLKVKLDTNGSHPEVLADLIEHELVDYIAMDIKSCLHFENYSETIGVKDERIIEKTEKSIMLIMNAGIDYEFRTTVVPGYHDDEAIECIAKMVKGARRYVLQNFVQSEKMLNPCLKDITPYSKEQMKKFKEKIEPYLQICLIR